MSIHQLLRIEPEVVKSNLRSAEAGNTRYWCQQPGCVAIPEYCYVRFASSEAIWSAGSKNRFLCEEHAQEVRSALEAS